MRDGQYAGRRGELDIAVQDEAFLSLSHSLLFYLSVSFYFLISLCLPLSLPPCFSLPPSVSLCLSLSYLSLLSLSVSLSRAGVDGVREHLGGRTTAGRVKLDAEILVGSSGVVTNTVRARGVENQNVAC